MKYLEDNKFKSPAHKVWVENVQSMLNTMRACNPNYSAGQISDGYHTFDELYHHRALLFAALVNTQPWRSRAWKSKQHHDPNEPMYEGMFIVGVDLPTGQATYHYDLEYWDHFRCKELDRAPVYDGHTPDEAIQRIFEASIDAWNTI